MMGLRVAGVVIVLLSGVFAYLVFAGQSPTRSVFIFLAIQFAVLAVIFLLISRARTRGADRAAQLLRAGLPADATVSSIQDTGVTMNNDPCVKLQLHVVPQNGDPFDVAATTRVSRLAMPRAGETYKIKYNAANPRDFVFVDQPLPTPIASFTVRATLNDKTASVGSSVVRGPLASALFKAAGGSNVRNKLNAALADPAVRDQLEHVHNADEAKGVLRSILGDQIDGANVTFQTKSEVISGTPALSAASQPAEPSIVDQLTKLEELRDKGGVTAEEFEAIKQKLLSGS